MNAIDSLFHLIKSGRGTPDDIDRLLRIAEVYCRACEAYVGGYETIKGPIIRIKDAHREALRIAEGRSA